MRPSATTQESRRIPPIDLGAAHDQADSGDRRVVLPDPAAVAAWVIPFALVVYLGMRGGGFEQRAYSEIGIAAWWLVGLGIIAGALPSARVGRTAWIGLGVLAAFAGWTAIGVIWSESSGRSVIEVARVVVYLGVFAVALLIGGRGRVRLTLGAIGAGVGVIAVVALLSRLHPSWFPENELAEVLVGVQSRLAYPLGYWNALAGLVSIGLPLVLWTVFSARSIALRALAAAAVPAMALTIYFTYSRGGLVATAASLLILFLLWERRLALIAPLGIVAGGSAFVLWQATRRPSLSDGLTTSVAQDQGDAMIVIVAGVGAIAAVLVAGLALLARRERIPAAPAIPRRSALIATSAVVVVGLVGFIGIGGPAKVSDGFEDFKAPVGLSDTSTRLASVAGNGRWQYWSVAAEAGNENPLTGIGPGTFVFRWAEERDISNGFVRDAHSLFVEVYGELGIVGLLLIGGFVLLVIGVGVRRCLTRAGERRLELAAATAAAVGFMVAAGVDWAWEIAVVPVAFLFVAAAILRENPDEATGSGSAKRVLWPWPAGIAALVVSLGAIVVIGVPMLSGERVTASQRSFEVGDLEGALEEAQSAQDLEPYSAAPRLQQALVLERLGDLKKAASAAQAAAQRESTNWETWYVLARIQGQRPGKQGSAVRALRRAQALDPFNPALSSASLSG